MAPPDQHDESFDTDGADQSDGPAVLGASHTEVYSRSLRQQERLERRIARERRKYRSTEVDEEIVFVYEPHTRFVPPIRPYLRELWARRAFAAELARSKVKGQRAGTALGGVWALLDPMFMVGLYYFLFTVIREGQRPTTFVPILISGILHFQLAGASLNEGGNSVSAASSLMLNSTFPRMMLPLSAIYGGVVRFLPSVPVILGAMIVLRVDLSWTLLWWFVLFALQVWIGLGLALIVSTAVVFFSDIKNVLNYVSRIIFFTSPVVYPADLLSPQIVSLVKWMPYFGVFANYQKIIDGTRPDFGFAAISLLWAVGGTLLGGWLFLRYEREFAGRL